MIWCSMGISISKGEFFNHSILICRDELMEMEEVHHKLRITEKLLHDSEVSNSRLREEIVVNERKLKNLKIIEEKYFDLMDNQRGRSKLKSENAMLRKKQNTLEAELQSY